MNISIQLKWSIALVSTVISFMGLDNLAIKYNPLILFKSGTQKNKTVDCVFQEQYDECEFQKKFELCQKKYQDCVPAWKRCYVGWCCKILRLWKHIKKSRFLTIWTFDILYQNASKNWKHYKEFQCMFWGCDFWGSVKVLTSVSFFLGFVWTTVESVRLPVTGYTACFTPEKFRILVEWYT